MTIRCGWVNEDPLYVQYHDHEWGVPVHEDQRLFEFLSLGGAQAGLSWYTILKRREHYRVAFDHFDVEKIARYDAEKIDQLMNYPGIIRNRLKIQSVVNNACAFMRVQEEFGSFDRYIWQFIGGQPVQNKWNELSELPAQTIVSDAMSKDLKKRGFQFVGSTICYAFMQTTGMVNDHTTSCYRYPHD